MLKRTAYKYWLIVILLLLATAQSFMDRQVLSVSILVIREDLFISDVQPVLRSLKKYHGKPGHGAGVEFKIKEGPITMLSINSTYDGKFKFVIAEGESVAGPIPPTGNTNTRGFFKPDIKTFLKKWISEGPTHHFALGIGNHAGTIKKIADYLNIEAVIVTE